MEPLHDDYPEQQRRLLAQVRHETENAYPASLVPINTDYTNDPARTLTLIAFLDPEMCQAIRAQLQAPLQAFAPEHYFYPPLSLHVTIKNVRRPTHPPNFTMEDVATVRQIAADVARTCAGVTFTFQEVLVFPNSISLIGTSSSALRTLVLALDRALRTAGLPDDKHYLSDSIFFGNITFCRFTSPPAPALLHAARSLSLAAPMRVRVDHLTLVTCNAAAAPQTIVRHGHFALRD